MNAKERLMLKHQRNVPVSQAAEMLGVSQQYIRIGLQRKLLPIGEAMQINGGRYTYRICPNRLRKFIEGEI